MSKSTDKKTPTLWFYLLIFMAFIALGIIGNGYLIEYITGFKYKTYVDALGLYIKATFLLILEFVFAYVVYKYAYKREKLTT